MFTCPTSLLLATLTLYCFIIHNCTVLYLLYCYLVFFVHHCTFLLCCLYNPCTISEFITIQLSYFVLFKCPSLYCFLNLYYFSVHHCTVCLEHRLRISSYAGKNELNRLICKCLSLNSWFFVPLSEHLLFTKVTHQLKSLQNSKFETKSVFGINVAFNASTTIYV